MNSDRIAQLHEQASERYLNGDYEGALQAWRDVLTMDPANEQAMDGVRMASQFAAPREDMSGAASPDVERELDQGLKIFDSLGAPAPADTSATMVLRRDDVDAMIDRKPAPAATTAAAGPDPTRQTDGIDFGDLSSVDSIPLGATDQMEMPEMVDDAPPVAEEEAYGLEPVSPAAGAASSAATDELHRRVADLMAEASAKAAAGERDEALAILSRLAILDEENAEAAELRIKLQEGGPTNLEKVEESIIEGVAALEADRLDDAERYFNAVLALVPEHREAQHYLEKVAEKRGGGSAGIEGGEDLLNTDLLMSEPAPSAAMPKSVAVPLAAPMEPVARPKGSRSARNEGADALDAPVMKPVTRTSRPPLKWVIFGGLGAIALVCGFIAVPQLMGGRAKSAPVPPPRPVKAAKAKAPTTKGTEAPAVTMTPAEKAQTIAASIAKGNQHERSGDFGAAVMSYNEALRLDPANVEAKAGLDQAAMAYKAQKSERDALESIKTAFKDGEYTAGLRMAYRLPATIDRSYVDAVKMAGWYNLGIVALRAGDCREALAHMNDALEIDPDDERALELKTFAERYLNAPKDRSFLDQAEAMAFRPLPATPPSIASR